MTVRYAPCKAYQACAIKQNNALMVNTFVLLDLEQTPNSKLKTFPILISSIPQFAGANNL